MYAATVGRNVKWRGTDLKLGAGYHWLPRWRRPWINLVESKTERNVIINGKVGHA